MVQAKMTLERTTKGAIRYQEVNDEGKPLDITESVIGTLYIRKSALDGKVPEAITVTVE